MNEQLVEQSIIELTRMVSDIHAVVWKNGLVKSVKEQQKDIAFMKENFIKQERDRLATCPYKMEDKKRREELEKITEKLVSKKYKKIEHLLMFFGVAIAAITFLPELISLL